MISSRPVYSSISSQEGIEMEDIRVYTGVCQKQYQFSCWNKNDPNYPYLSGAKPIPVGEMAKAVMVATAVIDGAYPDPTGGATHYYATTMPKAPAWAAKAKQTLKLGRHIFFKDVP
ncbi:cell wall hydrolase [Pseudomonas sp. CDFA 553]|nr:cell wall hydrolase [Pseudomonas quasicaspiana]